MGPGLRRDDEELEIRPVRALATPALWVAILFAAPVSIVFFVFQRYLVGGLAVGGVKG